MNTCNFLTRKHSFFLLLSRHTRVLPITYFAEKQRPPSSPLLLLIIICLWIGLIAKQNKAMRRWEKFSAQTCLAVLLKHQKPKPVPQTWELRVTMTSPGELSHFFLLSSFVQESTDKATTVTALKVLCTTVRTRQSDRDDKTCILRYLSFCNEFAFPFCTHPSKTLQTEHDSHSDSSEDDWEFDVVWHITSRVRSAWLCGNKPFLCCGMHM